MRCLHSKVDPADGRQADRCSQWLKPRSRHVVIIHDSDSDCPRCCMMREQPSKSKEIGGKAQATVAGRHEGPPLKAFISSRRDGIYAFGVRQLCSKELTTWVGQFEHRRSHLPVQPINLESDRMSIQLLQYWTSSAILRVHRLCRVMDIKVRLMRKGSRVAHRAHFGVPTGFILPDDLTKCDSRSADS